MKFISAYKKSLTLFAIIILTGGLFTILYAINRELKIPPPSQVADISSVGSGLVAHFTFDEGSGTVANDSSGSSLKGSLGGSATWTQGRIGGAVDLTASGSSISFGDSPAIIENKSALTIAFWIRAAPNAPEYVPIFHNQTNSSQVTFQIVKSASGNLEFKVFTSSSITAKTFNNPTSGSGWNHVVGVYDGAKLYIYVNGSLSSTPVDQSGLTKDTFGPLLLANGSFDDVRIYSRALSASEVSELYNYTGATVEASVPPIPTVSSPAPSVVLPTPTVSLPVPTVSLPTPTVSVPLESVKTEPVPTVTSASVNTCSTVSYFSRNTSTEIKWTFDKAYTCGQFANGDWWVVGPAVITSITPNYTGKYNGWEVNPTPTGMQGFDGRSNLNFNPSRVLPLPYTAKPGDSIVKAISRNITNDSCESVDRPCLLTAAVLTVLGSVPPDNGATVFRPPYVGTSKPLYSTNSLRLDLLSSLPRVPTAGSGDMSGIKDRFRPLQLDHLSYGYGRALRPIENLPDYGALIGRDTNTAILKLLLDYPIEQKKSALINLIQYGIDLYQMHILGHSWNQGGLTTGRRPLLAFTAIMLDNSSMKDLLRNNKYTTSQMFEEDAKVQRGKGGVALYGDVSSGEYGYWSTISTNGSSGDKMVADPYGYIDGGSRPGDNYTNIIAPANKAATVIAILMPSIKDAWNHTELQEVIDYTNRYYTFGLWASPDPCAPYSGSMSDYGKKFGPNGSGGCITGSGRYTSVHGSTPPADSGSYGSTFVNQMWNTYNRYTPSSISVPSPTPVAIATPSVSPVATRTVLPTPTASLLVRSTVTPTIIPTPIPTKTLTPTASPVVRPTPTISPEKSSFTRSLRTGMTGTDVRALQVFLNKKGFTVSVTGAGSPGKETSYYGPATTRAVTRFQEAYANEILKPIGLNRGTGFFGPATIKKVNSL